jgi:hypothetical protein
MEWLAIVLSLYLTGLPSNRVLVLVVGMEFFADHTAFIPSAVGAEAVGTVNIAAMGAAGDFGQDGFPVGTTVGLIGMTNTLLRNWHGDKSSIQ